MRYKSILLLTLISTASIAEIHKNGDKLTADFNDITVEAALGEIADSTGISIITSQSLDKKITISYPAMTAERLLKRLLHNYNALYLHDSHGGLSKVRIFTAGSSQPVAASPKKSLPNESTAQNGKYYLTVMLNGKAVDMLVDSGASITAISQATATQLGLLNNSKSATINTAGGTVTATQVVIDNVQMAGKTLKNVRVVILPQLQEAGLVGQNILAHYRRFTEGGKMRFEAIGDTSGKQPEEQPEQSGQPQQPGQPEQSGQPQKPEQSGQSQQPGQPKKPEQLKTPQKARKKLQPIEKQSVPIAPAPVAPAVKTQ